jgi:hypothetical protein
MPTTRILDADHRLLQSLAQQTGKQHQEIIHEALETYHRDRLLDEINAAFGRLKADPVAWQEELGELNDLETARSMLGTMLGGEAELADMLHYAGSRLDARASEELQLKAAQRAHVRLVEIGRFWR